MEKPGKDSQLNATIIKKLPSDVTMAVTCTTKQKEIFYIVKSKKDKLFYLYKELTDKSLEKIGKGKSSPYDFNTIVWGTK